MSETIGDRRDRERMSAWRDGWVAGFAAGQADVIHFAEQSARSMPKGCTIPIDMALETFARFAADLCIPQPPDDARPVFLGD